MPQVNGKYKPNMKAPRTPYVEELPEERAQDFRPVDRGYSMADAVAEANRCLDCKNPKCVQGCPVNINIPGFIEKIREGDFGGGLDIIREASLLPSVCGRVCPQENQCEGNCVLNNKDRAIAIGQLERFLGDNATELAHDPEIKPSNGKKVVVFGGGNVAMDAARTALRLGADTVTLAYRRTEEEMPARKAELHHAKQEGVKILPLVSPLEFEADENGFVSKVKLERMELGEPDESGRRRPHPIEGSEFEIPCDVAVTAIGTNANPFPKLAAEEVALNKWGYIEADENGRTSDPRIWAGGDIVTGAATVILAMGAGKKAAHSMMEVLEG